MKRNLILFTSALVLGAAIYSWQKRQETLAAEAARAEIGQWQTRLVLEEQRLAQRLAEAEKQNEARRTTLERSRTAASPAPVPKADAAAMSSTSDLKPDVAAAQRNLETLVMKDAALQRQVVASLRVKIGISLAPFFKARNLSPAQIEQFKDIMAQAAEIGLDLKAAEQVTGMSAPSTVQQGYRNEINGALTTLLGEEGIRQYRQYSRAAAAQDRIIATLAGELANTDSPLTAEHAVQLTQVLADASSSYQQGGAPTKESIDWNLAVARAHGVLSPQQLARFQKAAAAEQASAKIFSLLRTWKPQ
jgi:hypothetical protein